MHAPLAPAGCLAQDSQLHVDAESAISPRVLNGTVSNQKNSWRFDFDLQYNLSQTVGPFQSYSKSWWVTLALQRGVLVGLDGNTSSRQAAHQRHDAYGDMYSEFAMNSSYNLINTTGQLQRVQLNHASNTIIQFQVSWQRPFLDPLVNCSILLWSGVRWVDRSAFECSTVLLGHPLHFNDTRHPAQPDIAVPYGWPAAGSVHMVSHLPSNAFAWREEGIVDTSMNASRFVHIAGALLCSSSGPAPTTVPLPSFSAWPAPEDFLPHHAPMLRADVGERHNCVSVYPGGVLVCMGDRSSGRLGLGADSASSLTLADASLLHLSQAGQQLTQVGELGVKYAVPSSNAACAALMSGSIVCVGQGNPGVVRNTSDPDAPSHLLSSPATYGRQALPTAAHAVSCGYCHCCAILSGGNFTCWGVSKNDGSCPGLTGLRPQPAQDFVTAAQAFPMAAPAPVVDIAASAVATCILTRVQEVFCFGLTLVNALGYGISPLILGDNEDLFSMGPLQMPGGLKVVKLLPAAQETVCAQLEDWSVVCWGDNSEGQLGQGDTALRSTFTPAQIGTIQLPRRIVDGCAGSSHTCVILHGGNVVCWGQDSTALSKGILGNGKSSGVGQASPVFDIDPITPHSPAVSISCSKHTTCVTTTIGTMQCWGSLANGIAGTRVLATSAGSLEQPEQLAVWRSPRLAPSSRLPVDLLWGRAAPPASNSFLQQTMFAPYGRAVEELRSTYIAISGRGNKCIVNSAQRVRCWGEAFNFGHGTPSNDFMIGDDEDVNDHIVTLQGAVQVQVGLTGSCAITVQGNIKCWGADFMMPYGNGQHGFYPYSLPEFDFGERVMYIGMGSRHACALLANATLQCWGQATPAMGLGYLANVGKSQPATSVGPVELLGPVVHVAACSDITCAVLADGRAQCWGDRSKTSGSYGYGRLQDPFGDLIGDNELPNVLGAVPSLEPIVQAECESGAVCFLFASGNVTCVGQSIVAGDAISVGSNHSLTLAESPQVTLDIAVTHIAVGFSAACATAVNGRVLCWGDATSGLVGNGFSELSENGRFARVSETGAVALSAPVSGGLGRLALGSAHACAVVDGGLVQCWGTTPYALGYGSTEPVGFTVLPIDMGFIGRRELFLGFGHALNGFAEHRLSLVGRRSALEHISQVSCPACQGQDLHSLPAWFAGILERPRVASLPSSPAQTGASCAAAGLPTSPLRARSLKMLRCSAADRLDWASACLWPVDGSEPSATITTYSLAASGSRGAPAAAGGGSVLEFTGSLWPLLLLEPGATTELRIDGDVCSDVRVLSVSRLSCAAPPLPYSLLDASAGAPVALGSTARWAAAASHRLNSTGVLIRYAAPILESVQPAVAASVAGFTAILTGQQLHPCSFSNTSCSTPHPTLRVLAENNDGVQVQLDVLWWSPSRLEVRIPPGTGDMRVAVVLAGQTSSPAAFAYPRAAIQTVSPAEILSTGESEWQPVVFTVRGSDLCSAAASCRVLVGEVLCAALTTSASTVTCSILDYAQFRMIPSQSDVQVCQNGTSLCSDLRSALQVLPTPLVAAVSPLLVKPAGAELVISGISIDRASGVSLGPRNTTCAVVARSAGLVRCVVGSGHGSLSPLRLRFPGNWSLDTPMENLQYATPKLTTLEPLGILQQASTLAGIELTFDTEWLRLPGEPPATSIVLQGGLSGTWNCSSPRWRSSNDSDTVLACDLPPAALHIADRLFVQATLNSGAVAVDVLNLPSFAVELDVTLENISPATVSSFGGAQLTLLGAGFESDTFSFLPTAVTVGQAPCGDLQVVSSSALTCTVPSMESAGSPSPLVRVTMSDERQVTVGGLLAYVFPEILSVVPAELPCVLPSAPEHIRLQDITVVGVQLFRAQAASNGSSLSQIVLDGVACTSSHIYARMESPDGQSLVCRGFDLSALPPPTPAAPRAVGLEVQSTASQSFVITSPVGILQMSAPPGIVRVLPASFVPGTLLSVEGSGLGRAASVLGAVTLGGFPCDAEWTSQRSLQVAVPLGVSSLPSESQAALTLSVQLATGYNATFGSSGGPATAAASLNRVFIKREAAVPVFRPIIICATKQLSGSLLLFLDMAAFAQRNLPTDSETVVVSIASAITADAKPQLSEFSLKSSASVSPANISEVPCHPSHTLAPLPPASQAVLQVTVDGAPSGASFVQVASSSAAGNIALRGPFSDVAGPVLDVCGATEYLATVGPDATTPIRLRPADVTCQPCPLGAVCGGVPEEFVLAAPGFYRIPWVTALPSFERCFYADFCLGGSVFLDKGDPYARTQLTAPSAAAKLAHVLPHAYHRLLAQNPTADVSARNLQSADTNTTQGGPRELTSGQPPDAACRNGHTGVLCSSCKPGFGAGGIAGCRACTEESFSQVMVALGVLGILCIIVYLMVMQVFTKEATLQQRAAVQRILLTHLQQVAVMVGFSFQWPQPMQGLVEVADMIVTAGSSSAPNCVYQKGFAPDSQFSAFRVRLLFVVALTGGLTTIAVLLIPAVFKCLRTHFQQFNQLSYIQLATLGWVTSLYLFYSPLTQAVTKMLSCVRIAGEDLVVEDLSVPCTSEGNVIWRAVGGVMMVVFVFGFPAFLMWSLVVHRHELFSNELVRKQFGFMYLGYRPAAFWYEGVVLLRKALLAIFIGVSVSAGIVRQLTFALSVLLSASMLAAYLKAYKTRLCNILEEASLVLSVCTLLGGMSLISVAEEGLYPAVGTPNAALGQAVSIFIVVGNFSFLSVCAYFIVVMAAEEVTPNLLKLSTSTRATAVARAISRARLSISHGGSRFVSIMAGGKQQDHERDQLRVLADTGKKRPSFVTPVGVRVAAARRTSLVAFVNPVHCDATAVSSKQAANTLHTAAVDTIVRMQPVGSVLASTAGTQQPRVTPSTRRKSAKRGAALASQSTVNPMAHLLIFGIVSCACSSAVAEARQCNKVPAGLPTEGLEWPLYGNTSNGSALDLPLVNIAVDSTSACPSGLLVGRDDGAPGAPFCLLRARLSQSQFGFKWRFEIQRPPMPPGESAPSPVVSPYRLRWVSLLNIDDSATLHSGQAPPDVEPRLSVSPFSNSFPAPPDDWNDLYEANPFVYPLPMDATLFIQWTTTWRSPYLEPEVSAHVHVWKGYRWVDISPWTAQMPSVVCSDAQAPDLGHPLLNSSDLAVPHARPSKASANWTGSGDFSLLVHMPVEHVLLELVPLAPDHYMRADLVIKGITGSFLNQLGTASSLPILSDRLFQFRSKHMQPKMVSMHSTANTGIIAQTACAVLHGVGVTCWGSSSFGSLGVSNTATIGQLEAAGSIPMLDLDEPVAQIVSSFYHACVRFYSGSVKCWGERSNIGMFGNLASYDVAGIPTFVGLQVPINSTTNVMNWNDMVQISASQRHTCGLSQGLIVSCFGRAPDMSFFGLDVASPGTLSAPSPADFPINLGTTDAGGNFIPIQVAVGWSHGCALALGGCVKCWGPVPEALGYGTSVPTGGSELAARPCVQLLGNTVKLKAFYDATCAILSDGRAQCWGTNRMDRLGLGIGQAAGPAASSTSPANAGVIQAREPIVDVAVAERHTCILLRSGGVKCWGWKGAGGGGYHHREGTDGNPQYPSATWHTVPLRAPAQSIEVGADVSCAALVTGEVQCWGESGRSMLGAAGVSDSGTKARPGMSASFNFAHAAMRGRIDGETTPPETHLPPLLLPPQAATSPAVVGLSVGNTATAYLLQDGTVRMLGNAIDGLTGTCTELPVALDSGLDAAWAVSLPGAASALSVGASHACAVVSNEFHQGGTNAVYCWGSDSGRALGGGGNVGDTFNPVHKHGRMPIPDGAMSVHVGDRVTVVLYPDGNLYCWGAAGLGECGYGTGSSAATAGLPDSRGFVPTNRQVLDVVASDFHTCALGRMLAPGSPVGVSCWGYNLDNQLGHDDSTLVGITSSASSIADIIFNVLPGVEPISVSANGYASCALFSDGTSLHCWGRNALGALRRDAALYSRVGVGSTALASSPPATLPQAAVSIVMGEQTACALLENGQVLCWGDKALLGIAAAIDGDDIPVGAISAHDNLDVTVLPAAAVQISSRGTHTCATLVTRNTACWGTNDFSMLGYGLLPGAIAGDDESVSSLGGAVRREQHFGSGHAVLQFPLVTHVFGSAQAWASQQSLSCLSCQVAFMHSVPRWLAQAAATSSRNRVQMSPAEVGTFCTSIQLELVRNADSSPIPVHEPSKSIVECPTQRVAGWCAWPAGWNASSLIALHSVRLAASTETAAISLAGGQQLLLEGSFWPLALMSAPDDSFAVRIGGQTCANPRLFAAGLLSCQAPRLVGTDFSRGLEVALEHSLPLAMASPVFASAGNLTVRPPQLVQVTPSSGIPFAGAELVLAGVSLAEVAAGEGASALLAAGAIRVQVSSNVIPPPQCSITAVSATSIRCQLSSGVGRFALRVHVAGQESGSLVASYTVPTASLTAPMQVLQPAENANTTSLLELVGSGIGTDGAKSVTDLQVSVGQADCSAVVISLGGSRLQCSFDLVAVTAEQGTSSWPVVIRSRETSLNTTTPQRMTVLGQPAISSVSGVPVPPAGGRLHFTGRQLARPGNSMDIAQVYFNNGALCTSVALDVQGFSCDAPPGAGVLGSVTAVRSDGRQVTWGNPSVLKYEAATIQEISPSVVSSNFPDMVNLTITMSNLHSPSVGGVLATLQLSVAGLACPAQLQESSGGQPTITCLWQRPVFAVSREVSVEVRIGGVAAPCAGAGAASCIVQLTAEPQVNAVRPSLLPPEFGVDITLFGQNFASSLDFLRGIDIGGVPCSSASVLSTQQIRCRLGLRSPAQINAALEGAAVGLHLNTSTGLVVLPAAFQVSFPVLLRVTPREMYATSGSRVLITLEGLALASADLSNNGTVLVGNATCGSGGSQVLAFDAGRRIQCTNLAVDAIGQFSAGSAATVPVSFVTSGGIRLTLPEGSLRVMTGPSVTSLSPSPAAVGETVSIAGGAFGWSEQDVLRVQVGTTVLPRTAFQWLSSSSLSLTAPDVTTGEFSAVAFLNQTVTICTPAGCSSTWSDPAESALDMIPSLRAISQPPLGVCAQRSGGGDTVLQFTFVPDEVVKVFSVQAWVVRIFNHTGAAGFGATSSIPPEPLSTRLLIYNDVDTTAVSRIAAPSGGCKYLQTTAAALAAAASSVQYFELKLQSSVAQPLWYDVAAAVSLDDRSLDSVPSPLSNAAVHVCGETELLSTQFARRGQWEQTTCTACPPGGRCAGRPWEALTNAAGFYRVPWSKDALAFLECVRLLDCPEPAATPLLHPAQIVHWWPHISPSHYNSVQLVHPLVNGTLDSQRRLQVSNGTLAVIPPLFAEFVSTDWHGALLSVVASDTAPHPADGIELLGAESIAQQCPEENSGVLCASCAPGYSRTTSGVCGPCGSPGLVAGLLALLVILLAAAVMWLIRGQVISRAERKKEHSVLKKILLTHLQQIALMLSFQLRWPDPLLSMLSFSNTAAAAGTSLVSFNCIQQDSLPVSRLRTLFVILLPLGILLLASATWGAVKLFTVTSWAEVRTRSIISAVVVAYLFYTPVSQVTVQLLTCVDISGQSRLQMDPDILCDSGENRGWQFGAAVPLLVFYMLGMPAAVFVLLRHPDIDTASLRIRREYGLLYLGYRDQAQWYEVVILLRKAVFAVTLVLLAPQGLLRQLAAGTAILLASAITVLHLEPYVNPAFNSLEAASIALSLLTQLGGMFLVHNTDDSGSVTDTTTELPGDATAQVVVTLLVTVLNALFVFFMLAWFFRSFLLTELAPAVLGQERAKQLEQRLRAWSQRNASRARGMLGMKALPTQKAASRPARAVPGRGRHGLPSPAQDDDGDEGVAGLVGDSLPTRNAAGLQLDDLGFTGAESKQCVDVTPLSSSRTNARRLSNLFGEGSMCKSVANPLHATKSLLAVGGASKVGAGSPSRATATPGRLAPNWSPGNRQQRIQATIAAAKLGH